MEQYWGESEVEALYQDVVKHNNVAANMAALTFRANVDTMEVQNLDQLFSLASGEAQRRFWSTMQAQSVVQSNFGMRLVNKGDQVKNTQYTFTGLHEVHEAMCLDLSGASRIPMTKLFGRSPAGMNATGESDLQNYYDYVDTLRESRLRPILQQLLPVLAMSAWGSVPAGLDITFPPLWTPKADELAKIAKDKSETIITAFQSGLIQVDTAQKELKKLSGETGMFDSITDEEIAANAGKTYQDVTALRDPQAGLDFWGEDDGPFDQETGDALTLDYPGQPRAKNGQFSTGKMLTGSGETGKLQSSPKIIGQNGGTIRAEDMPKIRDSSGLEVAAKSGSNVTKVHTFAGKGTKKPVRIESQLISRYGGAKGQWQHTTGDVEILIGSSSRVAEVHWFQEPSVGIVGARIKRWR